MTYTGKHTGRQNKKQKIKIKKQKREEIKMKDMKALNIEELNKVAGGVVTEVVNCPNSGANIRETPGLDGKVAAVLANGTQLELTGSSVEKDGIVWYQVHLATGSDDGWVAGSLIGF